MTHRNIIVAAAKHVVRTHRSPTSRASHELTKQYYEGCRNTFVSFPPTTCRTMSSTGTSTTSRQEERERERAEKRARREAAIKKRAETEAYLKSSASSQASSSSVRVEAEAKAKKKSEAKEHFERATQIHNEGRALLLEEAASLTKSLYRTCMRSVQIIRPGNEHDEKDFEEREEAQLKEMEDFTGSSFFSMAPPVDRNNELSSRAAYYYDWTKENFGQESGCLRHNPWSESDVDRYLHFLRNGEKRRRFLLRDYKFPDPYPDSFDKERVRRFETQAHELVRDFEKAKTV